MFASVSVPVETQNCKNGNILFPSSRMFSWKIFHIYSWGRPATITPFVWKEGEHTYMKNVMRVEWKRAKREKTKFHVYLFADVCGHCIRSVVFERFTESCTFSTSLCEEHLKYMIWIEISIFAWEILLSFLAFDHGLCKKSSILRRKFI